MATSNDVIYKEIRQIRITLMGDGTEESMQKSLCYRMSQIEKQLGHNGDNGKERRKGAWRRMPKYQKVIVAGGVSAVFFRPEIKEIITVIVKSYLGIE